MRSKLLRAWPAAIVAAILLSAWPGYLSFDSAFQFYQARTGIFFDIAPPMFPWIWSHLLDFLPASSGMLLLFFTFYAVGFGLLAANRIRNDHSGWRWLYLFLLPLCPILLLLLPHLWTDVLLAGVLLCCFGLAAHFQTGSTPLTVEAGELDRSPPNRRLFGALWLLCILLLCTLASAIRHNSIVAVAPILWLVVSSTFPALGWIKRLGMVLLALLAIIGINRTLSAALIERRLDTWAVSMMFDLQAVSIARQQILLPPTMMGPSMTVQQLKQAYNPYSGTLLFSGTQSGVMNPTISPLSKRHAAQLRAAWAAQLTHPAFWKHRLQLSRGLFGTHRGHELRGLADAPGIVAYQDNPSLERSFPSAHAIYRAAIDFAFKTPIFSAGGWMLLALLLTALRIRHLDTLQRWKVALLLSSAWMYALPYLLIAPSAELRYLLWPALASWIALLEGLPYAQRPGDH